MNFTQLVECDTHGVSQKRLLELLNLLLLLLDLILVLLLSGPLKSYQCYSMHISIYPSQLRFLGKDTTQDGHCRLS